MARNPHNNPPQPPGPVQQQQQQPPGPGPHQQQQPPQPTGPRTVRVLTQASSSTFYHSTATYLALLWSTADDAVKGNQDALAAIQQMTRSQANPQGVAPAAVKQALDALFTAKFHPILQRQHKTHAQIKIGAHPTAAGDKVTQSKVANFGAMLALPIPEFHARLGSALQELDVDRFFNNEPARIAAVKNALLDELDPSKTGQDISPPFDGIPHIANLIRNLRTQVASGALTTQAAKQQLGDDFDNSPPNNFGLNAFLAYARESTSFPIAGVESSIASIVGAEIHTYNTMTGNPPQPSNRAAPQATNPPTAQLPFPIMLLTLQDQKNKQFYSSPLVDERVLDRGNANATGPNKFVIDNSATLNTSSGGQFDAVQLAANMNGNQTFKDSLKAAIPGYDNIKIESDSSSGTPVTVVKMIKTSDKDEKNPLKIIVEGSQNGRDSLRAEGGHEVTAEKKFEGFILCQDERFKAAGELDAVLEFFSLSPSSLTDDQILAVFTRIHAKTKFAQLAFGNVRYPANPLAAQAGKGKLNTQNPNAQQTAWARVSQGGSFLFRFLLRTSQTVLLANASSFPYAPQLFLALTTFGDVLPGAFNMIRLGPVEGFKVTFNWKATVGGVVAGLVGSQVFAIPILRLYKASEPFLKTTGKSIMRSGAYKDAAPYLGSLVKGFETVSPGVSWVSSWVSWGGSKFIEKRSALTSYMPAPAADAAMARMVQGFTDQYIGRNVYTDTFFHAYQARQQWALLLRVLPQAFSLAWSVGRAGLWGPPGWGLAMAVVFTAGSVANNLYVGYQQIKAAKVAELTASGMAAPAAELRAARWAKGQIAMSQLIGLGFYIGLDHYGYGQRIWNWVSESVFKMPHTTQKPPAPPPHYRYQTDDPNYQPTGIASKDQAWIKDPSYGETCPVPLDPNGTSPAPIVIPPPNPTRVGWTLQRNLPGYVLTGISSIDNAWVKDTSFPGRVSGQIAQLGHYLQGGQTTVHPFNDTVTEITQSMADQLGRLKIGDSLGNGVTVPSYLHTEIAKWLGQVTVAGGLVLVATTALATPSPLSVSTLCLMLYQATTANAQSVGVEIISFGLQTVSFGTALGFGIPALIALASAALIYSYRKQLMSAAEAPVERTAMAIDSTYSFFSGMASKVVTAPVRATRGLFRLFSGHDSSTQATPVTASPTGSQSLTSTHGKD